MTDWSRRAVLATAVGGLGALIGTAPAAHADATLAADLDVIEYDLIAGAVSSVVLRVTNRRDPGDEPIDPVVLGWGQGRQSLLPWEIANDQLLPPGVTRDLQLRAPGDWDDDHLRFVTEQPALLRLFDKGTERRADVRFMPLPSLRGGD